MTIKWNWRKSILFVNLLVVALALSPLIGVVVVRADNDAWSIVSSPNEGPGGNYLNAIAANSTTDVVAVGTRLDNGAYKATTQKWDGSSWTVKTSQYNSTDSELFGVSRNSSPAGEFWSVGYQNGSSRTLSGDGLWYTTSSSSTLIDHSTDGGSNWTLASSPSPSTTNVLRGVSDRTSSDVWAVGYSKNSGYNQTLILHYNGTSWSTVNSLGDTSEDDYLFGVSALASNDVWAVGDYYSGGVYNTLILHYNGTSWSEVDSPDYSDSVNELYGVTAIGSSDVWAVGAYQPNNKTTIKTFILHYDGSSWTQYDSPNVGTDDPNYL